MKYALLPLIALFLSFSATAQQMEPPPAIAAKAWLLYDYTTGQVLASENGDDHIEPASLTKLMTAYLTFAAIREHRLSLDQALTPKASHLERQSEESRMFLIAGKPATVDELLRGLIVQSGNDAARVLADAVAGSETEFTAQMNREAQRLGMNDTHFANSTGLPDPQHYSSAHDLALLAAAILRDFPEHYPLYSLREYQYNNIRQNNRNRLLWMDPHVDGMKTGHTESAGFCLVASARRDQRRLVSVLIGAASDSLRASESQKLLNYGFQYFQAVRLYRKDQPAARLRLWKGTENQVPVGFRNDLVLSVPAGRTDRLKATMETRQPLTAPIENGQRVGVMKFSLDGKPYAEFPLFALETVPLANVFSRGWDNMRLLFQ